MDLLSLLQDDLAVEAKGYRHQLADGADRPCGLVRLSVLHEGSGAAALVSRGWADAEDPEPPPRLQLHVLIANCERLYMEWEPYKLGLRQIGPTLRWVDRAASARRAALALALALRLDLAWAAAHLLLQGAVALLEPPHRHLLVLQRARLLLELLKLLRAGHPMGVN